MNKILLLLYFFRVCLCDVTENDNDEMLEINEISNNELSDEASNFINGTHFRTIKKYYCHVDTIEEPEFLLYGTKAWTFPTQDVSLTLSYPKTGKKRSNKENYVLTEFKVFLYIEGSNSKGYIRRGGILKDHINLNFVFRNLSSLSYQFFLYGVPKNVLTYQEDLESMINLC